MFKKLLLKIAVPYWDGHPDNSAKLLIDQMDKMHIKHQMQEISIWTFWVKLARFD